MYRPKSSLRPADIMSMFLIVRLSSAGDNVAGILSRRNLETLSSIVSNPSCTARPTASPVTVLLALCRMCLSVAL